MDKVVKNRRRLNGEKGEETGMEMSRWKSLQVDTRRAPFKSNYCL